LFAVAFFALLSWGCVVPDIVLGIDLGTTFSVVAYVDDQGRPRVVDNAEGKQLTPSVVLIEEDGQITVGDAAANQAIVKHQRVIRWIKRCMGDEEYRFCGLSPVDVSAQILGKLKRDSEAALGTVLDRAVITCPAYFAANEVENTRKAGQLAGFQVEEIIREPTAAAVYYGVENLRAGERVLVYDLGGGTFDATILEFRDGVFRPLATLGDRQLGGHDWTTDLLNHVARQLAVAFGEDPLDDPVVHQMLYERCETAKCDLARIDRVVIPCALRGKMQQFAVDIRTFQELTEHGIQKTVETCSRVLTKATPALTWSDIHRILPVGGSSRLRRVAEALEEVSGIRPERIGEVDTAVALGAAILARGMCRRRRSIAATARSEQTGLIAVRFERSCPRNLGTRIIVWVGDTARIDNSVIIPYNTALPTGKTRSDYATNIPDQQYFDVPIVEFDGIGEDVILGTYRFYCVPGTPRRSPMAVTFHYDRDAAVEVEAQDLRSGEHLRKEKVAYVEPDVTGLKQRPRDIIFALDVSGSMQGEKLMRAKDALRQTAAALLQAPRAKQRVGLATFSTTACRPCELTEQLSQMNAVVGGLTASGSTRMDLGITLATEMLGPQCAERLREIALVTDGMPDDKERALRAAEAARQTGVRISAVGIGSGDVDEAFLRQIASGVLMIDSADQLGAALPALLTEGGGTLETSITWGGSHD
jgi:molecular chaperone DnaK